MLMTMIIKFNSTKRLGEVDHQSAIEIGIRNLLSILLVTMFDLLPMPIPNH